MPTSDLSPGLLLALVIALAGCGDEGDGMQAPPPPPNTASSDVFMTFTNKHTTHSTTEVYAYFLDVKGNILDAQQKVGAALVNQRSYSFDMLKHGVRLSSLHSRVFVSLGKEIPANSGDPEFLNPAVAAYNTRFGFFEATYANPTVLGANVANLSHVDYYGVPITLNACTGSTVNRSLSYSVDGNAFKAAILAASTDPTTAERKDGNDFLRVLAPKHVWNAYRSFDGYVTDVRDRYIQVMASSFADISDRLLRFAPGCACTREPTDKPYENCALPPPTTDTPCRYFQQNYTFAATFTPAGDIELIGGGDCIGATGWTINIPTNEISQGIYTGAPSFTVNGVKAPPGATCDTNDVFQAAVRDLVAGFSFGYVDSNAYAAQPSKDWFKATEAFSKVQPSDPYYDEWAEAVFLNSKAYGSAYSDRLEITAVQANFLAGDTLEVIVQPDVGSVFTGTCTNVVTP